jgi:hypothetical protein
MLKGKGRKSTFSHSREGLPAGREPPHPLAAYAGRAPRRRPCTPARHLQEVEDEEKCCSNIYKKMLQYVAKC